MPDCWNWTFDEVMLDGDLAWEACARNSGVVKVIEKHLRGGRRAGTACAKRPCTSVCVCVRGRWICSSRMKMMTAKQRRSKAASTSKQFQNCSDSAVSRNSPGEEGRAELSFVWAACGATCALRCGICIGWTFDEVMLDGDLACDACARNSGVVKVIEKTFARRAPCGHSVC